MQWLQQPLPSATGNVIANGSDVSDIAVGSGVIYAVDWQTATGNVYKSTDGGKSWTKTPSPGTYALTKISVAPDNDNVIAVTDGNRVYSSTDGGASWTDLTSGGLPAPWTGAYIADVAVAPARTGTLLGREYVIAISDPLSDNTSRGDVLILGATNTWTSVVPTTDGASVLDYVAVAVTPNFVGDRSVVAIGAGRLVSPNYNAGVYGQVISTSTPVSIQSSANLSAAATGAIATTVDFGSGAAGIVAASIALPSDFDATTTSGRRAYVGFSANNTGSTGDNDVYRIDDTSARALGAVSSKPVWSVSYAGTQSSGTLIEARQDTQEIKYSTDMTSNSPTWTAAKKVLPLSITGIEFKTINNIVVMAADFATSRMVYQGSTGADSGFAVSMDGGISFDQISLIDANYLGNNIGSITGGPSLTVDGNTMFIATAANVTAGYPLTISVWKSPAPVSDSSWSRVFVAPGTYGFVSLSPDYATTSTLYLFDLVAGGNIYRSTDGGATWNTRLGPAAPGYVIFTATFQDASIGYVTDAAGDIYKTIDGAWSWSGPVNAGVGNVRQLVVGKTDNLIVGGTGKIAYSNDGGATFTTVNGYAGEFYRVTRDDNFATNNTIYLASDNGTGNTYRLVIGTDPAPVDLLAPSDGTPVVHLALRSGVLYSFHANLVDRTFYPLGTSNSTVPWRTMDTPLLSGMVAGTVTTANNTNIVYVRNGAAGSPQLWAYSDYLATAKPVLTSPASGTTVNPGDPVTLTWNGMGSGSGLVTAYQVLITETAVGWGSTTMSDAIVVASPASPSVTMGPSGQFVFTTLAGKEYQWRARASDEASGDNITSPFSDPFILRTRAKWTFMVYMAADNDLTAAALDDLNEMEVAGSTDNVNVIALMDLYGPNNTTLYRVTREAVPSDNIVSTNISGSAPFLAGGELNMGDPATLATFASWTMNNYPADRYALVLWNHGNGWKALTTPRVKWIGIDQTSGNDYLTTLELGAALSTVRAGPPGVPLDIVGFDACLMQMVEIAAQIGNSAVVMVGAEEVVPEDGWPYDTILAALTAAPAMNAQDLGSVIVSRYLAAYPIPSYYGLTMSAVNLAAMPSLLTAINSFADSLVLSGLTDSISTAMLQAEYYDDTDYIDLYDFADRVQALVGNPTVQSNAAAVKAAVANAAFSNGQVDRPNSHGLSIYCPVSPPVLPNYASLAFASGTWDEFLSWVLTPPAPPTWTPILSDMVGDQERGTGPDIVGVDKGIPEAGQVAYQVRLNATANWTDSWSVTALDTDQNSSTGSTNSGAEYAILVTASAQGAGLVPRADVPAVKAAVPYALLLHWVSDNWTYVAALQPYSADGFTNSYWTKLPLALVGKADANIDVIQIVGMLDIALNRVVTDVAPNSVMGGWFRLITDTVGEATPDITQVDAFRRQFKVGFRVSYNLAPDSVFGMTFLDTDENAATGFAINDIGADYKVEVVRSATPTANLFQRAGGSWTLLGPVPFVGGSGNFTFEVLLSLLGNDEGIMKVVQTLGAIGGPVTDTAPDSGNATVGEPPWAQLVADPTGDGSPDMTGVDVYDPVDRSGIAIRVRTNGINFDNVLGKTYIDIDSNNLTGYPGPNGIGAEYLADVRTTASLGGRLFRWNGSAWEDAPNSFFDVFTSANTSPDYYWFGLGAFHFGGDDLSMNIVQLLGTLSPEGPFDTAPDAGWAGVVPSDTTPPTVLAWFPTGTGVPVNTTIWVLFSESMNVTATQAAFSMNPGYPNGASSGLFSWSSNNMTFTPPAPLAYGTNYTVTISTDAIDLAGNNMTAPKVWSFVTGSVPVAQPPVVVTNNATDITASGATLRGTLVSPGGYGSANVSFEYWTASTNVSTSPQPLGSAANFTAIVTGLTGATTYNFRARAQTSGANVYGATLSFPTYAATGTTVEVNSGSTISLALSGSQGGTPVDIKGLPNLGPGNGMGNFGFDLTWNPAIVRVDNVTMAAISGWSPLAGDIDNTLGRVTLAGATATNYLTGNVTVATLGITAAGSPGASGSISVANIELNDQGANPIAASPVHAPVQIINLLAETALFLFRDSDGIIVVTTNITRVKGPGGVTATMPGGMDRYSATASSTPAGGVQVLSVRGVSPFASPTFDNVPGIFGHSAVASPLQPDNSMLAKLVPILTGNCTTSYSLTVAYQLIGAAGDAGMNVPEEHSNTLTFRRGDAKQDGVVNLNDAMFILQYYVGKRTLSDLNALDAASVKHDSGGDKIDLNDAMFILQYYVGKKDAYFNPR